MTEPNPRPPDQAMIQYVTAAARLAGGNDARDRISDRYARFYAPLAVGSVLLAFLPLFDDVDSTNGDVSFHESFGTVFQMAGSPGGSPAVLGLILLAVLVTLLSVATFRARSAALPACAAVVAALIALMLITKPATGDPTPSLSDSGTAGLVLTICVVVIGFAHAIHLAATGRRP